MVRRVALLASALCLVMLCGIATAAETKDPIAQGPSPLQRGAVRRGHRGGRRGPPDPRPRQQCRPDRRQGVSRTLSHRPGGNRPHHGLANGSGAFRRKGLPITSVSEFVVGLGQALYFDNASGAAAQVFGSVLEGAKELAPASREHIVDWWLPRSIATAKPRPEIERQGIYQRIRDRMSAELALHTGNAAALYWAAAAARSQGTFRRRGTRRKPDGPGRRSPRIGPSSFVRTSTSSSFAPSSLSALA